MQISVFVIAFSVQCYAVQFGQTLGRKMFDRFHHGQPNNKPRVKSFDRLTFMLRKHGEIQQKLTKTPVRKQHLTKYMRRYLHTIGNQNLYNH